MQPLVLRSGIAAPIVGDASMRRLQISGALPGTTPVTASAVHIVTYLPGTTPNLRTSTTAVSSSQFFAVAVRAGSGKESTPLPTA